MSRVPPSSGTTSLAQPLTLPCGLTLPNRIVKAAMTEALADGNNDPTARLEQLYRRFADGGPGLILTGNVMVDRRHLERARNVVADAATDRAALERYAAACRAVPTVVQLSHPGRQANRLVQPSPVGPSPSPPVGMAGLFARPRALTVDEITDLRRRFVAAARLVVGAGFAGVQIHAAHGYLLSTFLSPELNTRDDAYGGSPSNRARLLLEIVADLREALPSGAAVGVKLNSADSSRPADPAASVVAMVQVATWLAELGTDFVEVSGGSYESPALLGLDRDDDVEPSGTGPARAGSDGADRARRDGAVPDGTDAHENGTPDREAYFWDAARQVAGTVDVPVILTGGFRTRSAMEATLETGTAALIGLGRPLAVDPSLARRLLDGTVDELPRPAPRLAGPATVQRLLGAAANTGWHRFQMERLGVGRPPLDRLPAALAAADYVLRDGAQALLARRRRFATAERADAMDGSPREDQAPRES
jgi:2,4-dienoyl-CoA reductase-like NADH-dependent reductase (Old Yellow Enzyme family)